MIVVAARVVADRVVVRMAFDRAIRNGLAAAGAVVLARVREKLSRIGHAPPRKGGTKQAGKTRKLYRDLRRGNELLNRARSLQGESWFRSLRKTDQARVTLARKVRDAGGLIDPPGGSPRLRSGQLRQSMVMEQHDDSVRVGSDMAMGPGSKGYAAAQEFGSRQIPARPYLRPAFREAEADAMLAFQRAAQEALR